MNGLSFLQKIIETKKISIIEPLQMYEDGGKVIIKISGETWMEDTLDQCISSIKQSLAIKYLEKLESAQA